MPFGKFLLYRIRFMRAGDLAGAWADFGRLAAQLNRLAVVLGLAISDHAGIAITYDTRAQRTIRKLAKARSTKADYFSLLSTPYRGIRADVVRDFEIRTESMKKDKDKEKEKGTKGKEKGGRKGG